MPQRASIYYHLQESQKPIKICKKIIKNNINNKKVGFSWEEF